MTEGPIHTGFTLRDRPTVMEAQLENGCLDVHQKFAGMIFLCFYMSRNHQTHQDPLRNHVLKTNSVFGRPAEVGQWPPCHCWCPPTQSDWVGGLKSTKESSLQNLNEHLSIHFQGSLPSLPDDLLMSSPLFTSV